MHKEPEQPLIRLPGLAQLLAAFCWLCLLLSCISLGLKPFAAQLNRFKLELPQHVLQLSKTWEQLTAITPAPKSTIVAKMSVKNGAGLCYHRLDFAAVNPA